MSLEASASSAAFASRHYLRIDAEELMLNCQ